jgi:glycosyltransferase involved in cell wall biosynthesis
MIVKDEEHILEQCLESISQIADEIVIVDTGSTDSTKEIASKYTKQIYDFKWIDDFSAARNFSISKASGDMILRWDADFIIKDSDFKKLQEAKRREWDVADIVYLNWNIDHGDDGVAIKSMYNYFVYRKEFFTWESPIHNKLISLVDEESLKAVYYENISVDHFKDKEIKSNRYLQTSKILKSQLSRNPRDQRLLLNYAENLYFLNQDQEALSVLQNLLKQDLPSNREVDALNLIVKIYLRNSEIDQAAEILDMYQHHESDFRYQLMQADLKSLEDPNKSIELFKNLTDLERSKVDNNIAFDTERYQVHPHLMLGKLYLIIGDNQNAKSELEISRNLTHRQTTKKDIDSLLQTL